MWRRTSQGIQSKPGDICSNVSENVQTGPENTGLPPIQMQTEEEVAQLGSSSITLWSLCRLLQGRKIRAWHQRLRATSLPQAAKGPRAELCSVSPGSSTDGSVHLKYSTGERQMGRSQKDLESGMGVGQKEVQHPPGTILSFYTLKLHKYDGSLHRSSLELNRSQTVLRRG